MRAIYVLPLLVFAMFAVGACEQAAENSGNANAEPVRTMQPAKSAEPTPEGKAESLNLKVYFSEGDGTDCSSVRAVTRTVPVTPEMGKAALQELAKAVLQELFKGPTEKEKKSGLSSFFSEETKGILDGVNVKDGAAYVNLDGSVMQKLSNATTSCGSQAFTASVEKTLTQFPTVKKVFFAIEGSPKDFYDWIQVGECPKELGDCSGKNF
jgi:spore germination protein GerM